MAKSTRQKLIKRLDMWHSRYVRIRDADVNGVCRCVTCGKSHHWKDIHCGHMHSRKWMRTRWDRRNTYAQCVACNTFDEGAIPIMVEHVRKLHGQEVLDELIALRNDVNTISVPEMEEILDELKKDCNQIKKEKAILW